MNNKYQVYVMLGLLAGIIFFSLMYPFMKIGSNSAAMKLEDLQTEFNSLKNSTMADAAKEKKLTELQLKMSNQKLKVEAEKDREANNDLDLTQIIVLSALCLSLIWVIFHKVEIIAYFFTVILFSISVYAYLKLKLNVDLLDTDTQIKIGTLLSMSIVFSVLSVYVFVIFTRSLHKKNMNEIIEHNPLYVEGYARAELYKNEAWGKVTAYGMYSLVSKEGRNNYLASKSDDLLQDDERIYQRHTKPVEVKSAYQQAANNTTATSQGVGA